MPTDTEIQTERQRLYDSAALREDINDDEATILLEWGEKHVVRLGQAASDGADLEQKARFLRQLIKNINRFVGQRQYNDRAGQLDYMEKVTKWLENPSLGFKAFTADELLDKLPSDTKDMAATLRALLDAIDPGSTGNTGSQGKPDAPSSENRLETLRGTVTAQSADGEGEPPAHPRHASAQGGQQTDPNPQPVMPTPEDARQSVLEHMQKVEGEQADEASNRSQFDGPTESPSLLDKLRQAVTDQFQQKHPDSTDDVALESRHQQIDQTQDEKASSANRDALNALRGSVQEKLDEQPKETRGENMSPHGSSADQQSRRDQFTNRPQMREEDEENGKNTK